MNNVINFILTQDWVAWIGAISLFLGASYGIAVLIPGEQPDKTIKWLLDITQKLSRK